MSSIIQQLKIWDRLIEQRIKFEELMHKCNSLPEQETLLKLKEEDKDGKLAKYQKLALEELSKLFKEYVNFEKTVEQINPNLLEKDILEQKKEKEDESMEFEEQIKQDDNSEDGLESNLSDEEGNIEDEELDEQEYYDSVEERPFDNESDDEELNNLNGGLKDDFTDSKLIEFDLDKNFDSLIENTETYLSTNYNRINNVRNDILNYWFEKTRFTLKGGKLDKNSLDAFEQSTVKSIEHLLLNRLKLIKRTQLKRGNYEIIGKLCENNQEENQINSELVEKRKKEIYDAEIFDDSDFYHQLLRELVSNLGASNFMSSSSSKVSPKWLKLMKERFKESKYGDTKATKARKIRYKVHNELVNFMTPMTYLNNYDDEQHSNLIKSIFGNSAAAKEVNEYNFDSSSDSD